MKMHKEALDWLRPHAEQWCMPGLRILDLGSREAGAGCVRGLPWDAPVYVGLDYQEGPGVDYVCDITDRATWPELEPFDIVVCAEVLEHCWQPRAVIANAFQALQRGGVVLVTAASLGRPPHSCMPLLYVPEGPPDQDGGYPPNPGEYYKNVDPIDLYITLEYERFKSVRVSMNIEHHDVYARGVKP